MSDISVVVCTKNRHDEVIRCIQSLMNQSVPSDEIIVVDSSETYVLNSKLHEHFHSSRSAIRYFHSKCGLVSARNKAIDMCTSSVIIFVDDDVVLTLNYIKEIRDMFLNDRTKRIGAVTGLILNEGYNEPKPYALINRILRRIFLLPRYGNGSFQSSGCVTMILRSDKTVSIEYLHGSNMAFRKEVLSSFRFDENLEDRLTGYAFAEDDEIGLRVSKSFLVVYNPRAAICHYPSSVRPRNRHAIRRKIIENHRYIFKRHFPQTVKHRIAFHWSLLGWVVVSIPLTIMNKNSEELLGCIDGLRSIFNAYGTQMQLRRKAHGV